MTLRNVATLAVLALLAASGATAAERDFDFSVGTFTTKVRRLPKPLTGSTAWIDARGEVRTRKVLGGRGLLEEIELDQPSGHLQALGLRLYDPATRLWSFHFANARRGTIGAPAVGAFKDGRAELYDQEDWEGRTILVRHIFAPVEGGYHFEQAFSADGGKSWEANWIADCARAELPALPEARDRNRDFDANLGKWRAVVSRPSGGRWVDVAGTAEVTPVWGGRASLLELHAGPVEGIGLRLYDPAAHTWSLNWVNANRMALEVPAVGTFSGARGEFVAVEPIDGRMTFVRQSFALPEKFEQAFSFDGGKTWEPTLRIAFEPPGHDG